MGGAQSTWKSGTNYWPEMLTHDAAFDGQNIYVCEYSTPALGIAPTANQLAATMWNDLRSNGVLNYDNIAFVAHSMGGIVLRAVILQHRDSLAKRIRFVYFFATPGSGAAVAEIGAFISKNPQFQEVLPLKQGTNVYLDTQLSDWRIAQFSFRQYCAYEEHKTYGMTVVAEESAVLVCTEPQVGLAENHISIVKPTSANSDVYNALKSAFLDSLSSPVRQPSPPSKIVTAKRLTHPAAIAPSETTQQTSPSGPGSPTEKSGVKTQETAVPVGAIPVINAANGIVIAGGTVFNPTVNNNNFGPPQRRLTTDQENKILSSLGTESFPRFAILCDAQDAETCKFARQIAALFASAYSNWKTGQTVIPDGHNPIPGNLFIVISPKDAMSPPPTAIRLRAAFHAAGIEVPIQKEADDDPIGKGNIELFMGNMPNP